MAPFICGPATPLRHFATYQIPNVSYQFSLCSLEYSMFVDHRSWVLMGYSICVTIAAAFPESATRAVNTAKDKITHTQARNIARRAGGQNSSSLIQGKWPIQCDASYLGHPNAHSCEEAWNNFPSGTEMQTFGDRTKSDRWDVPLPFRFISRMSASHGTRYRYIVLIQMMVSRRHMCY